MLESLLRSPLSIESFVRLLFWKGVVSLHGGSIGKDVVIHRHAKLASSRQHPIHIGNQVTIMQGAIISTARKGEVYIGNHVYIGEYTVITSNSRITIEDDVMIAPHNNIVDFNHTYADLGTATAQDSFTAEPIVIQKGAWIASACCILKGVTIGPKTTVGAGSVVTKSLPGQCVAAGNPAKTIKTLS